MKTASHKRQKSAPMTKPLYDINAPFYGIDSRYDVIASDSHRRFAHRRLVELAKLVLEI